MNKIIFLTSLTLIMQSKANAQKVETVVPDKVQIAFKEKFPEAKKIAWEQESDNEWEGEFKKKGVEYSANFNSDGEWIESEHEIKTSEIPSIVKNTLDAEFTGFKIEESEIAETTSGTFYEFELENDDSEFEIVIDAAGKLVKNESENENEEEDDKD